MTGDDSTPYGFTFGPLEVTRTAAVNRGKSGVGRILTLRTPYRELQVYVSDTGAACGSST